MNNFAKLSLVVVLAIAGGLIAFIQTQSKPEPQNPDTIVVAKTEVILDAVVRDKKGRPVTNLSAKDFEVYENGGIWQCKRS